MKKSFLAFGLAISMSLSLPLLSHAQQPDGLQVKNPFEAQCPLIIHGQRVSMVENISSGNGHFGTVILAGSDHLEDSDFVVEQGNIIQKQLNTDNGKLPQFDMSEGIISSTFGTPGKVDHITVKDYVENSDWYICLYRLPDSMSAPGELKEFEKYVITVNGYQSTAPDIGWQKNEKGYWYNCGNGAYPADEWKEIGGKSYYFGSDGYMWADCWTPDGYFVDASGAWVPGYDEELTEGAEVTCRKVFFDASGVFARDEYYSVPVTKVSEINDLYNNFKENDSPLGERLSYIMIYAKSYKEKYPSSR